MKNLVRLIILLSGISLVGLIFTQLYWIRSAISLANEQFNHRTTNALNEIINELAKSKKTYFLSDSIVMSEKDNIPKYDKENMDSLLKTKFDYQRLNINYVYSIVKCTNDSVDSGIKSKGLIDGKIPNNIHRISMTRIFNDECYELEVYFPSKQSFIIVKLSTWLSVSIVLILILVFSSTYISINLLRQKKLSEMKNDFINNMTHELKTPISTISLATEVLLKSDQETSFDRIKRYSRVIYDENSRLKTLVERVLQIAIIEKESFKLNKIPIDIHSLLKETYHRMFIDQLKTNVDIRFNFEAKNYIIEADKFHITNIITNLLDNAYKYSKENPKIEITTKNHESGIMIAFLDNGQGMTNDTLKHIFEKFYRIPTGNVHNVKGFGLGLYYVKNMIEAHDGYIHVKSEINVGSQFDIFLPLNSKK